MTKVVPKEAQDGKMTMTKVTSGEEKMTEILNEKMASLERDAEVCGSDEAVSEDSNNAKKQEYKDDALSDEADNEASETEKNEADESGDDGELVDEGDDPDDELNVPKGDVGDDIDVPEEEFANDIDESETEVADDIDETEQELADDLDVLRSSLSELSSLRSIDDLAHPEEYARFCSLGLTPREAYLATGERREPRVPKRITAPMSVKRDRSAIPEYYLKMAREIFGGLSDREIQSLYKRVSRKS